MPAASFAPQFAHLGRIPSSKKDVARWTVPGQEVLQHPDVQRAIREHAERERARRGAGEVRKEGEGEGGVGAAPRPPPAARSSSPMYTAVPRRARAMAERR